MLMMSERGGTAQPEPHHLIIASREPVQRCCSSLDRARAFTPAQCCSQGTGGGGLAIRPGMRPVAPISCCTMTNHSPLPPGYGGTGKRRAERPPWPPLRRRPGLPRTWPGTLQAAAGQLPPGRSVQRDSSAGESSGGVVRAGLAKRRGCRGGQGAGRVALADWPIDLGLLNQSALRSTHHAASQQD